MVELTNNPPPSLEAKLENTCNLSSVITPDPSIKIPPPLSPKPFRKDKPETATVELPTIVKQVASLFPFTIVESDPRND